MITISIPIEPRGKDRPRARYVQPRNGKPGFTTIYTTAETRKYEIAVQAFAVKAMRGLKALDGPLTVMVDAVFSIPASWSNAKAGRAMTGIIRPTGKPDYDNVAKAITDAFNKIVFNDDAQIVDFRIRKWYGKTPGITVKVRETEAALFERDDEEVAA